MPCYLPLLNVWRGVVPFRDEVLRLGQLLQSSPPSFWRIVGSAVMFEADESCQISMRPLWSSRRRRTKACSEAASRDSFSRSFYCIADRIMFPFPRRMQLALANKRTGGTRVAPPALGSILVSIRPPGRRLVSVPRVKRASGRLSMFPRMGGPDSASYIPPLYDVHVEIDDDSRGPARRPRRTTGDYKKTTCRPGIFSK